MNQPIIEVKNLGKKYQIGEKQSYLALRDTLTNLSKSPLHWLRGKTRSGAEVAGKNDFWALQDLNFEVKKGEVLGIIGRNGAGKSTLLKILSQITPPTTGEIKLRGRVGSLLEVGTGFHPELTGRENIYLNGAILGMRKKEIESKFDEIVEFSGIEKFLDTPVKRYSSGMYVRLAFAVAAHMDPEILIVDEVLAVGDAEFQKKCLGKMKDITSEKERTILFVSHNMAAIENLCSRVMLLDKGKVVTIGKTREVIDTYLNLSSKQNVIEIDEIKNRKGNGAVTLTNICFQDKHKKLITFLRSGDDVYIKCTFKLNDPSLKSFIFSMSLDTFLDSKRIAFISGKVTNQSISTNQNTFTIILKNLSLNAGKYIFSTSCTDTGTEIYDWIQKAGEFEVEHGDFYGTGNISPENAGVILLDYTFTQ